MENFNIYVFTSNQFKVKAVFYPSDLLPPELPITTPFTFPILDKRKVVLSLDKMKWWNPLGGHIEKGEDWQQALIREAREEAGVLIDNIKVFGYIQVEQIGKERSVLYPRISQLPMTFSVVKKFYQDWIPQETFERGSFSFQMAQKLLAKRRDNQQMYQVFRFLIKKLGESSA